MPEGSIIRYGPFFGLVSAIDAGFVQHNYASDMLNAWLDQGSLKTRRGWRNMQSAQSSFTVCRGLYFATGYNTSYVFQEEYISFETRSGTLKPYSRAALAGAPTEITDGGGALSLTDGQWYGFSADSAFWAFLRATGTVYKHAVGTSTSWDDADENRPADPTTALSIAYVVTEDVSATTPATAVSWAGGGASTVVERNGVGVTPDTFYDSIVGTSLYVRYSGNDAHTTLPAGGGLQFYRLDLSTITAGVQDWSAIDSISFTLTTVSDNDAYPRMYAEQLTSIAVELENSTGTKVTMVVAVTAYPTYGSYPGYATWVHEVTLTFPSGYTPSDWTSTKYLNMSVVAGAPTHDVGYSGTYLVIHSQLTPGTAGSSAPSAAASTHNVKFGYAYYDSLRDTESENVKETARFYMESPDRFWDSGGTTFLGNEVTLGFPVSSEAFVDKVRLYAKVESDGIWRLMDELADSAASYTVSYTYASLLELPARIDKPAEPIGTVACGTGFRGWVVWGYARGKQNIRHSKVGSPHVLVRTTDELDLIGGPADFTLASDFADEPLAMHEAADALVVIGKRGVYAQVGDTPKTMTPFKKIALSRGGFAPRTSCRMRDLNGNPGVAYLADDQETIWFVQISQDQAGDDIGHKLEDITPEIRGKITAFFGALDSTKAHLFVDERSEALWLVQDSKALVFRRPTVLSGTRHWEPYQYYYSAGTGWSHWASHPYYGIRAMRSTGAFDELEHNSASSFADITGTNRDGGTAVSSRYWTGERMFGQRRRVMRAGRDAASLADALDVTATIDGGSPTTKTIAANKRFVRFHFDVVGFAHTYKFAWGENASPTKEVDIIYVDAGDRLNK